MSTLVVYEMRSSSFSTRRKVYTETALVIGILKVMAAWDIDVTQDVTESAFVPEDVYARFVRDEVQVETHSEEP